MSAVSVSHLSKRYGDLNAVDGISFEVPEGQLLAMLGPNGAGKTTTLEILEGFIAPSGGKVRVLGADPHHGDRAWRSRVGLVLQSTGLDAELTVRNTLLLFAQLYAQPWQVDELLELVDLTEDAQTRVGALSGGQRRRVDVAIGMLGRPDILFLDEPTTGLDPEARRRAWAVVHNLTSTGTTVVLTTHYIDEAEQLADRVIVLSAGRILADTTPQALRAQAGPPIIRLPLSDSIAAVDLPAALAAQLDIQQRTLVVRSTDTAAALRELVAWADRHSVDLSRLEVGPPSLEDAYLTVIGQPPTPEVTARV